MNEPSWNRSILCVDDEEGIIEAYRTILGQQSPTAVELRNALASRRMRRKGGEEIAPQAALPRSDRPDEGSVARARDGAEATGYTLFTATSGEEAVAIVKEELAQGRRIAIGFFDMVMPGGIDGLETVKRIRELDGEMLCAFVTAYTDHSPDQIGKIFSQRDEWLYLNKPFTAGELLQTADHLVTVWNKRQTQKELSKGMRTMHEGLLAILGFVRDTNRIQPLLFDTLSKGLLRHYLNLVGATDGFFSNFTGEKGPFHLGMGLFSGQIDFAKTPEVDDLRCLGEEALRERKSILTATATATPLYLGKNNLGVLVAKTTATVDQDPHLLDIFAMQAVSFIEHTRLYEELDLRNNELSEKNQELLNLFQKLTQSQRLKEEYEQLTFLDFLTGIPNRRYLETRLREEMTRCRRHELALAFLMIDIDHFKAVNDDYGHAAGDHVLKEVGQILSLQKRPYDMAARYGGEEFAVIFGHIQPEFAAAIADRLRLAVANHRFIYNDKVIPITISIGLAVLRPGEYSDAESIFKKADEALYLAKNRGRNRCEQYVPRED